MFFKIVVLKNFAIFTGKHQCWSLFLIKLQTFRLQCFNIKKRFHHRCFPVNIAKFVRTAFFMEHLWWLLLEKYCRNNFASTDAEYKISGPLLGLRLSLLHNFIHLSLNSGSAQVQTLLAACRRFAMVRISDNVPGRK